jgi:hypothetical protein
VLKTTYLTFDEYNTTIGGDGKGKKEFLHVCPNCCPKQKLSHMGHFSGKFQYGDNGSPLKHAKKRKNWLSSRTLFV